jgi:hypothetical protein
VPAAHPFRDRMQLPEHGNVFSQRLVYVPTPEPPLLFSTSQPVRYTRAHTRCDWPQARRRYRSQGAADRVAFVCCWRYAVDHARPGRGRLTAGGMHAHYA